MKDTKYSTSRIQAESVKSINKPELVLFLKTNENMMIVIQGQDGVAAFL